MVVGADDLGVLVLGAVLETDGDRIRAIDDVLIGENITVLAQDDTGTLLVNVARMALRQVLEEKLERLERSRLAVECGKLDPEFEKSLAEEGMSEDLIAWPEY